MGRRQRVTHRDLTITKLERDENGRWHCRVTTEGVTITCHRYGGWQYETDDPKFPRKFVPPDIAAAIQLKVYPIEQRERREREKQEEKVHARIARKKAGRK